MKSCGEQGELERKVDLICGCGREGFRKTLLLDLPSVLYQLSNPCKYLAQAT